MTEPDNAPPAADWSREEDRRSETMPRPGRSTPAVEQLLEEVEADTEPRGQLTVGGLRGRVAIVTGGSSGIGRAVAVAFARSGVHVAFNFLDEGEESCADADRVVAELEGYGVRVLCRAVDCGNSESVGWFVEEVVRELGGLHILVNNAGIGRDRALWRMEDEEWNDVLRTNLTGAFHFLRAASPHFRAQEFGKVVNISSVHAIRSEFGLANYAASKAGLLGLTRSAAIELGPSNVNVNAVAPGYIRTTQLTERVPSEILDKARERSALGRLGDPQDVAGAVIFLCSEAARHITGVVLPVDAGYIL
ncbi:MAG: 3-oxoacyl-ACP reductase FabG [Gemmatimonadales bacterium]|nr:MAG: 3-oxoacyl-ACP reductase FabG [Gemmatimonadales bacterium]